MCRPRFCEVQENDAAELQQFQQASQKYNQTHHRRESIRNQYRQKKREDQQTRRDENQVQNVCKPAITYEEVPVTPGQRVVASGIGTVAMSLFMTPLDVVKVRMQAQQQIGAGKPLHSLPANATPRLVPALTRSYHSLTAPAPVKFTGTMDGLLKIAKCEGLPRLWSGLPPTLLMRVPSNVIYFTVYEEMKYLLGFNHSRKKDTHNTIATSAASGTARGMSITAVSPLELVRTRIQAKAMSYRELSKVLEEAVKMEGWSSLWKGLGPQILRDVPYAIIYWTNYEMLKTQLSHSLNTGEPTVAITFCAGAISGVFASTVTTPFDVVKTHKQLSVGSPVRDKAIKVVKSNTWTIMKKLYGEAGIRALFTGLIPRVIKAAPASAILVTSYEFTISAMKHYNATHTSCYHG